MGVQVRHDGLPCDVDAPPCGSTCGKLLSCGVHHCSERCHVGPCPATCRSLVEKSCMCGKMQKLVPCSETNLRCSRRRWSLLIYPSYPLDWL